jgi:pimeloyl-ACP methyl ester carboxylesterase
VDERTVSIGGRQIAFLQSDGGGRAVVFVHGNSSSARTWLPVLGGAFGVGWPGCPLRCGASWDRLAGEGLRVTSIERTAYPQFWRLTSARVIHYLW